MEEPIILSESISDVNDRFKNSFAMIGNGLTAPVRHAIYFAKKFAGEMLEGTPPTPLNVTLFTIPALGAFVGGGTIGFLSGVATLCDAIFEGKFIQPYWPEESYRTCGLEHKIFG